MFTPPARLADLIEQIAADTGGLWSPEVVAAQGLVALATSGPDARTWLRSTPAAWRVALDHAKREVRRRGR